MPARNSPKVRWRGRDNGEEFYRHCKQTFERAKLHSKNPDNALVELQWSLMGMWAMGLFAHVRLVRQGAPVRKISFVGVLDAFRHAMREHGLRPPADDRLRKLIAAAVIDDYQRVNKASRGYPQQK